MSKEPANPPETEIETPEDRWEHEIEDLEKPLGRSGIRQWVVGLVLAGGLVGAFFLGASLQQKRRDSGSWAVVSIDTLEPRPSALYERPTAFRWESISKANSYIVTIREEGEEEDLIARVTSSNSIELTPGEKARLVKGGRYSWTVRATSEQGRTIGMGQSAFTL